MLQHLVFLSSCYQCKVGSSSTAVTCTATAMLLLTAVMVAVGTAKRFFKVSVICITATAFVMLIKSGLQ